MAGCTLIGPVTALNPGTADVIRSINTLQTENSRWWCRRYRWVPVLPEYMPSSPVVSCRAVRLITKFCQQTGIFFIECPAAARWLSILVCNLSSSSDVMTLIFFFHHIIRVFNQMGLETIIVCCQCLQRRTVRACRCMPISRSAGQSILPPNSI